MKKDFFGKKVSPFTIPSGIITTSTCVLERVAKDIPEIGILTTKSIGLKPRQGYKEPILTQIDEKNFSNAVGLANPGVEAFVEELKEIYPLPDGKFLLTSIFGGTAEEFAEVAKLVAPYSDGIELNVSCPHAKGYGAAIGTSAELTAEVVKAVKEAVKIPVIVKLTPLADNIEEIVKAAVEAGADGFCAINTNTPIENIEPYTKKPILTNIKGGTSGKKDKSRGLEVIKSISKTVDKKIPIIAMGGIFSAEDIRDYSKAGASFFGIGTALAGMDTSTIKEYFNLLASDLKNNTNKAEQLTINKKIMEYKPYKIEKIEEFGEDFKVFYFDKGIKAEPGQFVFVWIPGIGEKPLSIAYNKPLTLAVRKIGCLTSELFKLKQGDEVLFRGIYGKPIKVNSANVYLVAGGCGAAPIYFLAKKLSEVGITPKVFLGARTEDRLLFKEEFEQISELKTITDDKGFVTDLLKRNLDESAKGACFVNCGPEIMIKKAIEIEQNFSSNEKLLSVIERYTKCGIGLCGSCSTGDGLRACIDGPVFDASVDLGRKRNSCGGYDDS